MSSKYQFKFVINLIDVIFQRNQTGYPDSDWASIILSVDGVPVSTYTPQLSGSVNSGEKFAPNWEVVAVAGADQIVQLTLAITNLSKTSRYSQAAKAILITGAIDAAIAAMAGGPVLGAVVGAIWAAWSWLYGQKDPDCDGLVFSYSQGWAASDLVTMCDNADRSTVFSGVTGDSSQLHTPSSCGHSPETSATFTVSYEDVVQFETQSFTLMEVVGGGLSGWVGVWGDAASAEQSRLVAVASVVGISALPIAGVESARTHLIEAQMQSNPSTQDHSSRTQLAARIVNSLASLDVRTAEGPHQAPASAMPIASGENPHAIPIPVKVPPYRGNVWPSGPSVGEHVILASLREEVASIAKLVPLQANRKVREIVISSNLKFADDRDHYVDTIFIGTNVSLSIYALLLDKGATVANRLRYLQRDENGNVLVDVLLQHTMTPPR